MFSAFELLLQSVRGRVPFCVKYIGTVLVSILAVETIGILVFLGTLLPQMSMIFEKNYKLEHVVHGTEVRCTSEQLSMLSRSSCMCTP